MIYCGDVDVAYQRAIDAGATSIEEPATFVTGDRFGVVMDPFGHPVGHHDPGRGRPRR